MAETPAQRRRREQKERSAAAKDRKRQARRQSRLRARLRRIAYLGGALLVVGAVAAAFWLGGSERRAAADRVSDVVVREPNRGRNHVAAATSQDQAPTSGSHAGGAVCGVRSGPVAGDSQIHSLEHGAIVVQYRPDDADEADVTALESFARDLGGGILVAPNRQLDAPVVATAWTRKMRLDDLDLDRIRDFVSAYTGSGPEQVDCPV